MEVIAAVLHDGKLAHYEVSIEGDGVCRAHLSDFRGRPEQTPPEHLTIRKEGRRWIGDVADSTLVEDLGYALEIKVKPLLDARKRGGGHPAG